MTQKTQKVNEDAAHGGCPQEYSAMHVTVLPCTDGVQLHRQRYLPTRAAPAARHSQDQPRPTGHRQRSRTKKELRLQQKSQPHQARAST